VIEDLCGCAPCEPCTVVNINVNDQAPQEFSGLDETCPLEISFEVVDGDGNPTVAVWDRGKLSVPAANPCSPAQVWFNDILVAHLEEPCGEQVLLDCDTLVDAYIFSGAGTESVNLIFLPV